MLSKDGVVRFADFASLERYQYEIEDVKVWTYDVFEVLGESETDDCEHSFERIVIIIDSEEHLSRDPGKWNDRRTLQIYLDDPRNEKTPSWVLAPVKKLAVKDAYRCVNLVLLPPRADPKTYIAAISFTPRHFFTNWTIILSLPPSPVSPESGMEIG